MGGGAFARAAAAGEPTLNTPRLSPKGYATLKAIYLAKIQEHLPDASVACLIEAPEKVDYGDIDILIASQEKIDSIGLANAIGAAGVICHNSNACTLAVPQDGSSMNKPVVVYSHVMDNCSRKGEPSTTVTDEEYAQIDIEKVKPELLEWHTFYSSYGDMLGLLGHIVTNLGFTVNDRGFWLRLKELDRSKSVSYVNVADRDGMVFLSSEPKSVMGFLGLSDSSYDAGFATLEELYTWLSDCRLLHAESLKIKRDNSHERRREQKRTIYTQFFYDWLPARMNMNVEDADAQATKVKGLRSKLLEEAVGFFEKQDEFSTKHLQLERQLQNAIAPNLLRPIVAQHSGTDSKHMAELMRAFRRYVGFQEVGLPCVVETPHSDADSQLYRFLADDGETLKDPETAGAWIEANWGQLKTQQRLTTKARDY